jgi:phosphoglycolate phosphatase
MAAPLIVFDLDGTLVDTAPDLVATLNFVFARVGMRPVAYAEARNMVGGGARMMIERGLAAEGQTITPDKLEDLVREFIAHYAAHIADTSRPFPGVEAGLDALAEHGCLLAVCTNKLEWLARRLLDALGLTRRFVALCGGDTFRLQKPDPELLRRTIALAGEGGKSAIMVGDSISDIAMAKAAKFPVIAVSYGYTETPVSELGADLVVGSFADVPPAVLKLASGYQTHTGSN